MYTKVFAALVLVAASAGCAGPTQVLVSQRYAGPRVVRYTIEPTGKGSDTTGALYDLRVRLCDVEGDGSDKQCQDSMVLQNVQPRSVY